MHVWIDALSMERQVFETPTFGPRWRKICDTYTHTHTYARVRKNHPKIGHAWSYAICIYWLEFVMFCSTLKGLMCERLQEPPIRLT